MPQLTGKTWTIRRVARLWMLLIGCVAAWTVAAQETAAPSVAPAVPAARQAERVAVITLSGPIDAITARSIRRRVGEAEAAGMDAIVLEVNSPGGELGAVTEISSTLKGSAINNTVAWINPEAISGGAISALACREIVVNSPASMGDSMIVTVNLNGPGQLRGLTPDERSKLLPVLMADITDSARRNGWDEYLVQAIVVDGVELWLVENTETGERLAVNETEYRVLFDREPIRGKPIIAGVTGGRVSNPDPQPIRESTEEAPAGAPEGSPFLPATDELNDIAQELASPARTDLWQELDSRRPVISEADQGMYRDLGFLTDGSAPIVMGHDQMLTLGFASAIVRNDEELKAFFGAKELIRVNESWSEKMVRLLTSLPARGILIAVMLLGLAIELFSPGFAIPGAVAAIALVMLILPPALIGMAGWWEILAILIGLVLIAAEIFVLPGFGVFGVLGIIALFGGMLGTFIPAGGSISNPQTQKDLMGGAVTMLLALVTAGIGIFFIARNFDSLPFLDRLVLKGATGVASEETGGTELSAFVTRDDSQPEIGDRGVTTTMLRPAGQAEIDGRIVDVSSSLGVIDAGIPVRVIAIEAMRTVVEVDTDQITTEDGPADEETA